MRVSVGEKDPGYRIDAGQYRVLFNGEPQSFNLTGRIVRTADEEMGFIEFYQRAPDGRGIVTGEGGVFPTFVEHGTVVIERMPD